MLSADPDERPSAQACLDHQWFKEDKIAIQTLITVNKAIITKNITLKPQMNIIQRDGPEENFNSFVQLGINF